MFKASAVGTGPYVLKEATKTKMTWSRNEKWWGAKIGFKPLPKPLELVWKVVSDEATSEKMLVNNDLDAAREYTLANFSDAKGKNAKIVGWGVGSPIVWNDPCPRQLEINTSADFRKDDKTASSWIDPNLRKALSLLLDQTLPRMRTVALASHRAQCLPNTGR